MQTKNTNETGGKGGNSVQRGGTVIKSLSALGDAIKDGQIDEFALLVRKGIDTWRTAGKLLLDMTNKDPGAMKRIQERSGLSHSVLMTFARIGRNEIWPPLLVDNSLGSQRLQQCNYDEQKKYAAEPIEVAIEWRGEKIKTAKRTISELSRYECGIVFSETGGIRTLEQQAFRLRNPSEKKVEDLDARAEVKNQSVRLVNVDIGYFSIVQKPDGSVTCEPCGKSPIAQPVCVSPNGQGFRSAIVLYYKQEMKYGNWTL
jgi:hypothetical protein